MTCETLS